MEKCLFRSFRLIRGFPGVSVVKNLTVNAGDVGIIHKSRRSPGGVNGSPLKYSGLEHPMYREAWWTTLHWVKKSQTKLSDWTGMHTTILTVFSRRGVATELYEFLMYFAFYPLIWCMVYKYFLPFYRLPLYLLVFIYFFSCIEAIESESEVTQLCPTLCDPMDCSLPSSSVHRIFQAIVLEWIAISFSRGSSWPRDGTWVSCIVDRCFTIWAIREIFYRSYNSPNYLLFGFYCLLHTQKIYCQEQC